MWETYRIIHLVIVISEDSDRKVKKPHRTNEKQKLLFDSVVLKKKNNNEIFTHVPHERKLVCKFCEFTSNILKHNILPTIDLRIYQLLVKIILILLLLI